jgi:hypothetical protein
VRGVDLAIYADVLEGESASLAARADRARSRLRQAAIEKRARRELTHVAVERLDAIGVLGSVDEAATRAELRELEAAIDAVEELQSWLERELASGGLRRRLSAPTWRPDGLCPGGRLTNDLGDEIASPADVTLA